MALLLLAELALTRVSLGRRLAPAPACAGLGVAVPLALLLLLAGADRLGLAGSLHRHGVCCGSLTDSRKLCFCELMVCNVSACFG